MIDKLLELRDYCKTQEKASFEKSEIHFKKGNSHQDGWWYGNGRAFSDIIERLDLILNNSCVKPSERRSPTNETFSGCKPPDRKAKSTDDKDKCDHESFVVFGQNGKTVTSCRKCGISM